MSVDRKNTIKYLLLGILLSSVSTPLFDTFGLPTFPELIYFPLLYYWQDDFSFSKKWRNRITMFTLFWLFILLCAVFNQRFSMGAILTTGRAYLYMGIFGIWAYAVKFDKNIYKKLYLISTGSLSGWILVIICRHIGLLPVVNKGINYGNMVAIPMCISIIFALYPILKNLLMVCIMNAYLSFTTALRRQILVTALSLLLSYLLIIKQKGMSKVHLPVFIVLTSLFLSLPYIEEAVKHYDNYTYERIFKRTRNAGSGDDHGDEMRVNNFVFLYDNLGDLQIPHGYVSKRTSEDITLGRFVDCPMYELFYTFGGMTVMLALTFYIFRLTLHTLIYLRTKNPYAIVWITCGTLCFFLLFVESTFLAYTYTSPMTGIVIGMLCRNPNDLIET